MLTLFLAVPIIASGVIGAMDEVQKARERALEEAVSRAVRDNLASLERALEELQQAYADLVAACSSSRPTNTLPAMLRAQATAASLSASLSVLSTFVTNVMQRREREFAAEEAPGEGEAIGVTLPPAAPREVMPPPHLPAPMAAEEPPAAQSSAPVEAPFEPTAVEEAAETAAEPARDAAEEIPATAPAAEEAAAAEPAAFEVASLPAEERELHRRANRVAKVSMQDIKMLRPDAVRLGREHKDICVRLRNELDKARKEYDRRFRKISDHPVDYFHRWMVEILAEGDAEALGEYPYPSPVLRR